MDEALDRRLSAIERRLGAIEAATGYFPAGGPPAEFAADIENAPAAASPPPLPVFSKDAAARTTTANDPPATDPPTDPSGPAAVETVAALSQAEAIPESGRPAGTPPPLPWDPARRPVTWAAAKDRPAPPPLARGRVDLENVVGVKWAGWAGAIVLVVGVAMGVKFAWEQGWFGGFSDAARCGLIGLGGLALIGLGEAVFRKINRLAASGFYASGIAVLYLAVFAAQAWYGLLGPISAAIAAAAVAAIGLAVAARADMVSVAALTVIGAVLCPAFTGAIDQRPPGFRVYLLAVQAMAIGLCAWRATPKWWALRGVALAATAFDLIVGIPNGPPDGFVLPGLIFALISTAVFQGELIFSTWRRPRNLHGEPVPGMTFSLLVTFVFAAMLLVHQGNQPRWVRGETLAWAALAAVTTGMLIARRSVGLTILGRGFFVQAALLLTLAVPVTLDGPSRLFGWMILAAALATLGAMTGDRLAAGGAAAVWGLAAVVTGDWIGSPASGHHWLHVLGEPILAATVVMAALTVVGHGIAAVLHRLAGEPPQARDGIDVTPALAIDLVAAALFAWTLVAGQSGGFSTRAGLAYAVALWVASIARVLAHLRPVALLVLTATSLKWALADVLAPRFEPGWSPPGRPFLNAQAATGFTLAAAFAGLGWTARRTANEAGDPVRGETAWLTMVTAAFVVLFFALAAETDRAVALARAAGGLPAWPVSTAINLWLTVVAAACVAGWSGLLGVTLRTRMRRDDVVLAARAAAYLLAAKFAIVDVFGPALFRHPPTPAAVWNLQTAVAVVVGVLVVWTGRRRGDVPADGACGLAVLGLLLVTGSAEIDRYALRQSAAPVWIVRQAGWSVYWAALAVATLVVGFVLRRRPLRLAALGLLTATLAKVTVVDLAGAGTGWRIVSLLALGALLLLTSVLYGKFDDRAVAIEA